MKNISDTIINLLYARDITVHSMAGGELLSFDLVDDTVILSTKDLSLSTCFADQADYLNSNSE